MIRPISESREYRLPSVCIIGAGPAGLTAAKALQDRGIPFDCFERADRVGGLWALGNRGGTQTAYRSLRPNTSKTRTELEDLPMPESYPDVPNADQIARYLETYADRFRLLDRIELGREVEQANLGDDGLWRVSVAGGDARDYDALIVASGHHWDPLWPEPLPPGNFDGTQIHARDYVDAHGLEGKTVVVVGLGNSAVDIAVDVSQVAVRTLLSTRRGAHILPRRLFGRPLDLIETLVPRAIRGPLGGRLTGAALRIGYRTGRIPNPANYGLPVPDHSLGAAQPTVSDELFGRIAAGAIVPRKEIAELHGGRVRFADGAEDEADLIIYCTGYRVSFPFIDQRLVSAPGNELGLFHRVFKPDLSSVFFIGFVQPIGPTIRTVEAQSKWVASHLSGEYALPERSQMERQIAADRERIRRRYVRSPRHTMQVDYWPYLDSMARESSRGRRRASRRSFQPPLPARAPRPDRPAANGPGPLLSVVLPSDGPETIRPTMRALCEQTIADGIELVIVGPSIDDTVAGVGSDRDALHSVRGIEFSSDSVPVARAAGIRHASAELVGFAETHCYPAREWAESLVRTHRANWAVVGPELQNENPQTAISRACMLVDYGLWTAPAEPGEVDHVAGHNSSYKRSVLLAHGDRLETVLQAETLFHWELRRGGERLYLQPEARLRHRNMTLLRPALDSQYQNGRSFAGNRALAWGPLRRAGYALGTVLLPALRMWRMLRRSAPDMTGRVPPLVLAMLIAASLGELVGYLLGPGRSMNRLSAYELQRDRWVSA